MAYSATTWTYREVVTSSKLQQMSDNSDYLKAAVEDPWTAYVPALTGVTVGNGALVGRYKAFGKTIVGRWSFTMGSTSAVTAVFIASLPVPSHASYIGGDPYGIAHMVDASVGSGSRVAGTMVIQSPTLFFIVLDKTTTAYGTGSAPVTNTVPWTWAVGDTIGGQFTYEAA